jgi:hypothetical protein
LKPEKHPYPLHLHLQTHADIMGSKVDIHASKPLMLIDGEVREQSVWSKSRINVISWLVPPMVTHFPSLTQQQASKLQMVRTHEDTLNALC